MSISFSLATAAIPAIQSIASGIQHVAEGPLFSFGKEAEKPVATEASQPKEQTAVANDSVSKRLEKWIERLQAGLKRSGLDRNAQLDISANGDGPPRIDSENLEASQMAEDWLAANPDEVQALNRIVQELRSGSYRPDPRRQTLTISTDGQGIATEWQGVPS